MTNEEKLALISKARDLLADGRLKSVETMFNAAGIDLKINGVQVDFEDAGSILDCLTPETAHIEVLRRALETELTQLIGERIAHFERNSGARVATVTVPAFDTKIATAVGKVSVTLAVPEKE